MFAHLFGLHPWDIRRLTVAEFRSYQQWAESWLKSNQSRG